VVKKVLTIAGVKDVWSFAKGSTSNIYNTAMATINALDSLNRMKPQPGDKE
jgi:ribosomal protein S5